MIRIPWTTTFKNRFSKLDLLKAVSVSMIVNSEKIKIKYPITPTTFVFPLPPPVFVFSPYFLKNAPPSSAFFCNFYSIPLQKKKGHWKLCAFI